MLTNQSLAEGPSRTRAAASVGRQRTASRAAAAHPGNATPATLGLVKPKAEGLSALQRQVEEEEEVLQATPQLNEMREPHQCDQCKTSHFMSTRMISDDGSQQSRYRRPSKTVS